MPAEISVHPPRVLLVEDGRANQVVATRFLERLGHEVTLAENGREALAAMGRESFLAVLMDVGMPIMDGLEATRCIRLREQEMGRHTPIIALTSNTEPGDREACLAAGMDDYLSKPVQAGELQLALERAGATSSH